MGHWLWRLPRSNGETCVMILRFRHGCKNSGKFWWMMQCLYTEALTPFPFMKFLESPRSRDVRIWVSTMFKLISTKTEIARFVNGPNLQRLLCRRRNGEAVPRAVNFGDLITADHKVLSDNCESRNNHRYAVVVHRIQLLNGSRRIRAKTKTSQKKLTEACKSSWSPRGSQKSFTLTIPWNSEKLVKISSWNHCTSTPHRSETDGIAEIAVRRVKEGTSAVLLQSGLNESWGADFMECYTYLRNVTDLLSVGRRPMKDVLGSHLKDLSFFLVH